MISTLFKISQREFKNIFKDARLRTVVLIAPFIYALVLSFVYINHTLYDIPIAVIQKDFGKAGRTLARMINSSPKLKVAYNVQSTEELKDLMLAGKIDAAVVIPPELSKNLMRGGDIFVPAFVNASSMVGANMAAKAINEVVQTFSAGVEIITLMKKGDNIATAKQRFMPVKLDLRPMFNPGFNYSNFMVPGIFMAILQQVILLGIALSWTAEKENKTVGELLKITESPILLMFGKAIPYFIINFLVAEFYLRVLFPINDIPMEGSWFITIIFTMIFIFTIITWGMWVSALCRTRLFATQILMFVAMPSFILSGFTWPAQGMPYLIQFFGKLLPLTYFVNSFRNIYLAAAPFKYVAPAFLALIVFSCVNLILGYFAIKFFVVKKARSS